MSPRVLYFECYRSRIDRPQRVQVLASPFPRVLTDRELAHRRRMLAHLNGTFSKGQQAATRSTR